MDIKAVLFKIEGYSEALGNKLWGIGQMVNDPIGTLLGLRVNRLTDLEVEIVIGRENLAKVVGLKFGSWIMAYGSETCANLLWKRHIDLSFSKLILEKMTIECAGTAILPITFKLALDEKYREDVLRKVRQGRPCDVESNITIFASNGRKVGDVVSRFQVSGQLLLNGPTSLT